ncbi:alpha/beta fold hydrolase [Xanthomonas translucens]|uniref:AB hydrolase-1 domain-containing protein n=1 Tax=Xanthomonas translucens pv. translucens DSM 18974 TaxID=1261556 RepID=A0A1C3TIY6_XANCT|nr:alpha/beta hydrolase [Xanthomonas translucens]KTF40438.1 hydrogenase expression protein [Xanthomonas translucens pv. translucens]KWV16395.1 hydrogenase expression protein [Xanthomonas translucens]MCC8447837.1 alpha/beta hydrolase [Xanthomonas translucens pv. translucens]MCS3359981.1 alpha/beta hydrolase [Xanthomonas translucens pv. translucens]MCS3373716.1 alpha/beta hydrolase [Xanthomonas translucens pv. translucens]
MIGPRTPLGKPAVHLLGDDDALAYLRMGDGVPVVLVHGALCDYRYWAPQLRGLCKRFAVAALSLGQYFPQLPSSLRHSFGWRWHAQQVAGFLASYGQPVHLVGHSRGAAVAWQAALQRPAAIASLSLFDPGGPQPQGLPEDVLSIRARAIALLGEGQVEAGLECFVDSVSQPGAWARSSASFRQMVRDNAQTLAPQIGDALPAYGREQAAGLAVPVLLVSGELSPAQYRDNASALAEWLPDARHHVLAGASHGMTFTHARRCNALIAEAVAAACRLD